MIWCSLAGDSALRVTRCGYGWLEKEYGVHRIQPLRSNHTGV